MKNKLREYVCWSLMSWMLRWVLALGGMFAKIQVFNVRVIMWFITTYIHPSDDEDKETINHVMEYLGKAKDRFSTW